MSTARIATFCGACAAVLVGLQLWLVFQSQQPDIGAPSPITYPDKWKPAKLIYHPGDVVRFTVHQRSVGANLLFLAYDNLENLETGEVYPGIMRAVVAPKAENREFIAIRSLPLRMSSGRYRLTGAAAAQNTVQRVQSTLYQSEEFGVWNGKGAIPAWAKPVTVRAIPTRITRPMRRRVLPVARTPKPRIGPKPTPAVPITDPQEPFRQEWRRWYSQEMKARGAAE